MFKGSFFLVVTFLLSLFAFALGALAVYKSQKEDVLPLVQEKTVQIIVTATPSATLSTTPAKVSSKSAK